MCSISSFLPPQGTIAHCAGPGEHLLGLGLPGEAVQEEDLLLTRRVRQTLVSKAKGAGQAKLLGRGMEVCEPLECSENSEDMWFGWSPRHLGDTEGASWAPDARARQEDFLPGQRRAGVFRAVVEEGSSAALSQMPIPTSVSQGPAIIGDVTTRLTVLKICV